MKKTLIVSLAFFAGIAYAGHPRCAGSYEPAKCEAAEAQLAAETPEQKKERVKRLETSRQASLKEVASKPATTATVTGPTCSNPKGWAQLGMDKEEMVRCGWGKPDRINRTTTVYGTEEQWVYRSRIEGYLYFDTKGILRSMQH